LFNDRLITEYWIGKDVEGNYSGLTLITVLMLPQGTEENHERLRIGSLDQGWNLGPSEYEAGVVTTLL
jgi:hypothetical protein